MEGSKAFSKAFMDRHNIPTAKFKVFQAAEYDRAIEYVRNCGIKVVLKASGLAAGKGVLLPDTVDEAIAGLKEIMVDSVFGAAGSRTSCLCMLRPIENIFLCLRQRSGCRRASGRTRSLCLGFLRRLHYRASACCARSQTYR